MKKYRNNFKMLQGKHIKLFLDLMWKKDHYAREYNFDVDNN